MRAERRGQRAEGREDTNRRLHTSERVREQLKGRVGEAATEAERVALGGQDSRQVFHARTAM